MKQAIECFHQVEHSIQTNQRDQSLLPTLQSQLFSVPDPDPLVYSRLLFSLYDLSNHHSLLSQAGSQLTLHPMGVKLKLLCIRMICLLMDVVVRVGGRLDQEIELEALEIMVLSVRVCLDAGAGVGRECVQAQTYCSRLYGYYCPLGARGGLICDQIALLYFVNKFDVIRLEANDTNTNPTELQGTLVQFYTVLDRCKQLPIETKAKYQEYIANIVAEITLKMLRQGKGQYLEKLGDYLPKQVTATLKRLQQGQLPSNKEANIGEVYELYWQIATNGMSSVSVDFLQKFISSERILHSQQLFQAILLCNQPLLLQIWFHAANNHLTKPPNLPLAYQCFISLLVTHLNLPRFQQPSPDLLRLCKQVLLGLFREDRNTHLPVPMVLGYLAKLVMACVGGLCGYEAVRELCEHVQLVSSKHNLTEISKTMTALHLYYDMLHHQHNEDTYKKFLKFNGSDKAEPTKLLKTCYQLQKGTTAIDEATNSLIKKRPEFALLFCDGKQRTRLLLSLENRSVASMQHIFQLYISLLEDNSWDDQHLLLQIVAHLQSLLQNNEFSKLSITTQSTLQLKNCLSKHIDKEGVTFSLVYLYLCCLGENFHKVVAEQYGVVFNRYSKLLKMLDTAGLNSEMAMVIEVIICQSCQKFKSQLSTSSKCSAQAGEIMFLKLIQSKLVAYRDKPDPGLHFIKFSMFQIYLLHLRNEQLHQCIDQQSDATVLHLYTGSQYIPRKYKLMLLRKLFRMNMAAGSSIISLNDMRELMLLAENEQETLLYVSACVQMFGERGRKFVGLLAAERRDIGELLLSM